MTMIESASVEANGWVLAVVGTWPESEFASFALDPDGTARVSLSSSTAGFDRTGAGTAAANPARPRGAIVATRPLRKLWSASGPPVGSSSSVSVLDETDLGGGRRRVRLALSRYIYAGDPVTVTFGAGWRAGLPGGSIVATNGSTFAHRLPSARWVTRSYCRQTGAFPLELMVVSHEPEQLSAAAAVRFVAYDGTSSHAQWATFEPSPEDGQMVWRTDMNPTGLTAGLITCHWEVYPWVGAMRRSGNGHAVGENIGFQTAAERPLMVAWDPAGTRYAPQHVYVDPVGGSTTASTNMLYSTLAAAKAGNRAANISTAIQAMRLSTRALSAANGYGAESNALDGLIVTLAPGTHQSGATTVSTSTSNAQARVIIQGDPDTANPRANCVWEAGQTPTMRGNMWWVRNMTVALGGATFTGSNTGRRFLFDNVTVQGKAGQEAATNSLTSANAGVGEYANELFGVRWWRYGISFGDGPNRRCGVARNIEVGRGMVANAILGGVRIDDPTVTANRGNVGNFAASGDLAGAADFIGMNILAYRSDGATAGVGLDLASGRDGALTSANPNVFRRWWLVNTLIEKINTTEAIILSAGDNRYLDCGFEGCTFVGSRFNWAYDQPSDGETGMVSTGNVLRNSHWDRRAIKGDTEVPQHSRTSNWSQLYGVDHEGNTQMNRVVSTAGQENEWYGLRTTRDPGTLPGGTPGPGGVSTWPTFVDDRCITSGTGNTNGGGDYRPAAGSPLILFGGTGRGQRANTPRFADGTVRSAAGFAAGALAPAGGAPEPAAQLAAEAVVHAMMAEPAGVLATMRVQPRAGFHIMAAAGAGVVAGGPPGPPPEADAQAHRERVVTVTFEARAVRASAR